MSSLVSGLGVVRMWKSSEEVQAAVNAVLAEEFLSGQLQSGDAG